MEQVKSYLKSFWQWLTGRKLEVEHIGMGAVIVISTWHVSQHMHDVEGNALVAVIMGAVLGFLNAVFAMRFFEERKETRWPAGVGVLFFAAVSIWMQYGFYDDKSDLTKYMVLGVNVNALAFGAWAPASEILLGWLYGVRLFVRGEQGLVIDTVTAKYTKMLGELQSKFDNQLMVNQQLRDDLSTAKADGQQRSALMAEKDGLIAELRSTVTDLRVNVAVLNGRLSAVTASTLTTPPSGGQGNQLPVKLTPIDRQNRIVEIVQDGHIVEDGEAKPITISGLARSVGVAVNTIKADLKALEAQEIITVNGSIHLNGHSKGG